MSVLKNMKDIDAEPAYDKLTNDEKLIILYMATWPMIVKQSIASKYQSHNIVDFAKKLAMKLHKQWAKGQADESLRFITDDDELTMARMKLVEGVSTVLKSCLGILSIKPVDKM